MSEAPLQPDSSIEFGVESFAPSPNRVWGLQGYLNHKKLSPLDPTSLHPKPTNHICIYTYTYIYIYKYMHIHIYLYIYIHIYMYVHIYIYTDTYIYTYIYINRQIDTYIYTYMCICICISICTHIYIYTYRYIEFGVYRGTSLIRNTPLLGPYIRTIHGSYVGPRGGGD